MDVRSFPTTTAIPLDAQYYPRCSDPIDRLCMRLRAIPLAELHPSLGLIMQVLRNYRPERGCQTFHFQAEVIPGHASFSILAGIFISAVCAICVGFSPDYCIDPRSIRLQMQEHHVDVTKATGEGE
ncbi:hypothetical protein PHLCEN_2v11340 [Hermanssonia centrifuga]|uniref:Uncharacterized protein n=1 Tax=Hermanssonia centrifuga TaxID=98765 RepID=A0A2R6NK80_9APHY|nr:hypothetical protein PHLCEN_2v11340 [Hermanssonia centrifuga]